MNFSEFSTNYRQIINKNIKISGESLEYFSEYKVKVLDKFFKRNGLSKDIKLLDLGCGTGELLHYIFHYFPKVNAYGLDPCPEFIKRCKQKYENKESHFSISRGENMPFENEYFDAVLLSCVFHHISPDSRVAVVENILRVLKRGGYLFIFEHNPLNPLTRRTVRSCVFDSDADLITKKTMSFFLKKQGFIISETRYIVFFPRCLKIFRRFEDNLGKLFLGAQYFVAARKR